MTTEDWKLTEEDWETLLSKIKDGQCTPFLGAGVNYGILPMGSQIAREWAIEESFPLKSDDDLASVAQFIAVKHDPMFTKKKLLGRLDREPRPDFSNPDSRLDCLLTLASLPLPIYLTTNYDDLMVEALRHTGGKKPRREICRWHDLMKSIPSALAGKYHPSSEAPLVFHLHGSDEVVQSLVLTEDDYLAFLVNVSKNRKLLPPRIEDALTTTSLLFIGYRLRDINFRVIHRGLVQSLDPSLRSRSITVQISPPDDCKEDPSSAMKYLKNYFDKLNASVYWGTAAEFAQELRKRL